MPTRAATPGYRSFLVRFPDEALSIAVLCNTNADTSSLAFGIADALLTNLEPKPEPQSAPSVTLDEAALAGLAGSFYDAERSIAFRVSVEGNRLYLHLGGQRLPLAPLSSERFRLPFGAEVEFRNGGSELTAFVGEGNESSFQRVAPHGALRPADYIGAYRSDELDVIYRIEHEDGVMRMSWLKRNGLELEPHSRDVFTGENGTVRFLRGDSGAVSGFALTTFRIRDLTFQRVH